MFVAYSSCHPTVKPIGRQPPKTDIRLLGAVFGQHDLPHLVAAGAKRAGAGKQVVLPHALELFVVFLFQPGPCFLEIFIPGLEGLS